MASGIGAVGGVSAARGIAASAESLVDGLEALVDDLQSQAAAEAADARKGPHAGLRANLGAACRKCCGGRKAPSGDAPGSATHGSGKEALLKSLLPLLETMKQLLASLKAQAG